MKEFKTKDQIVIGARLHRLKLTKSRAKLKKIKSLMVRTNPKPRIKMKMTLNFKADD